MRFVFIDEFGCTRPYAKHQVNEPAYHPTRGYAGVIVPTERISTFFDEFLVLKVLALRQWASILQESTKGMKSINSINPKILDRHIPTFKVRQLLGGTDQPERLRSAVIRAEIKSQDFFHSKNQDTIDSRIRLLKIFIDLLSSFNVEVFFSGYEKKSCLPAPSGNETDYFLFELKKTIDILHKVSVRVQSPLKLFFDRHSMDEKKSKPFARKRKFDEIVINKNLHKYFPETITADIDSRCSIGIQVADWVCGVTARHLGYIVEPKAKEYYRTYIPDTVSNSWKTVTAAESILRHSRGNKLSKKLYEDMTQLNLSFPTGSLETSTHDKGRAEARP